MLNEFQITSLKSIGIGLSLILIFFFWIVFVEFLKEKLQKEVKEKDDTI